jgi:hypothetical protein
MLLAATPDQRTSCSSQLKKAGNIVLELLFFRTPFGTAGGRADGTQIRG